MPGFFVCLRRTVCPTPTCVGNTMRCPRCPRLPSVHPHMRGEYQAVRPCVVDNVGSSPHAWGILPLSSVFQGIRRFIPTCVGNTPCGLPFCIGNGVHPHMRGEYAQRHHAFGQPVRFIPTCVGNTPRNRPRNRPQPVHPHMRGEYAVIPQYISKIGGSSPHAWGIPTQATPPCQSSRFIPTCVGNTSALSRRKFSTPVHPHMRGEYWGRMEIMNCTRGSSPHAWGILIHQPVPLWRRRFIPTCVGNTTGFCVLKVAPLVHPHMRGEYICWAGAFGWPLGSSPHAWGILLPPLGLDEALRFIPTCVGNTPRRRAPAACRPVHPHMRGEYVAG